MKPVSAISVLSFVCSAALALSGCAGYQLGDAKPTSFSGIRNIHVPTFKNETLEPRLSSLVTNAVIKEFQVDGTYKITNRANCDAVLVGSIGDFEKTQLRAFRTNTLRSRELMIRLICNFHLADPNTGEVITGFGDDLNKGAVGGFEASGPAHQALLVRQGQVIGKTIQVVDDSFQVGERGTLAVAAEDLATQLVSQLANGW